MTTCNKRNCIPGLVKPDIKSEVSEMTIEETKSDKNPHCWPFQMLCDTQRKAPKTPKISENSPMSDHGASMASQWACNQAVSGDSAIKCPFVILVHFKGGLQAFLGKMHLSKIWGAAYSGHRPPHDAKEGFALPAVQICQVPASKQLLVIGINFI